jgi:predicted outer membrane repeat protein
VVSISNADQSTVLDGLIITAGQTLLADEEPYKNGAGLLNQNASPRLHNLIFSANAASSGGAIYNINSSPTIRDSSFSGNVATLGGAIFNTQSNPTIRDTSFSDNIAYYGGAIHNRNSSNPNISHTSFSENSSTEDGGAIYNRNSGPFISNASFFGNSAADGGGAIINIESSPTISNTSFMNNTAKYAGAIDNSNSSLTMNQVSFSDNVVDDYGGAISNENSSLNITNASFLANVAGTWGGAIDNYYGNLIIHNASFSGNAAGNWGGAIANENGSLTINNASFSGNSAIGSGTINNHTDAHLQLSNSILWANSSSIQFDSSSDSTISYSLIEGCKPSGTWNSLCGVDGGGNLADTDPLFMAPTSHTSAPNATGDLHLQAGSPVIDKGNSALNPTTEDRDGKPRIIGSAIDLGAYETGYVLDTAIIGEGTLSLSPNSDWYAPNTSITLTAIANPGWTFEAWGNDLSGSTSPATVLMNHSKFILVTFSNDPPIANAGADRSLMFGTSVTLDGSASFDADPNQTLTYAWAQTASTPVSLTGANTAQPSFTAPSVVSTLTFSLVVTDNFGAASVADSVTISVTNGKPVAHAGADQTVKSGHIVTLDGSGSSDPDGNIPLSYAWTQISGTPIMLTGANTAQATFTAPSVAGALTFSLVVTDSTGLVSIADTVTVTVTNYLVHLPFVQHPPVVPR